MSSYYLLFFFFDLLSYFFDDDYVSLILEDFIAFSFKDGIELSLLLFDGVKYFIKSPNPYFKNKSYSLF